MGQATSILTNAYNSIVVLSAIKNRIPGWCLEEKRQVSREWSLQLDPSGTEIITFPSQGHSITGEDVLAFPWSGSFTTWEGVLSVCSAVV